jgi:hypothetical protein
MIGGNMTENARSRSLAKGAVIRDIERAIFRMDSGRIILTVRNKRIAQVEYLEKDWCEDVWAVGGGI